MRDASAPLLYDFGYSMLAAMSQRSEEQAEARDKLDDVFLDMAFTEETGLPAIAQQFGPADGSTDFPEGF